MHTYITRDVHRLSRKKSQNRPSTWGRRSHTGLAVPFPKRAPVTALLARSFSIKLDTMTSPSGRSSAPLACFCSRLRVGGLHTQVCLHNPMKAQHHESQGHNESRHEAPIDSDGQETNARTMPRRKQRTLWVDEETLLVHQAAVADQVLPRVEP